MVPLSHCPKGSKVRIRKLCDGAGGRSRLCALGITPGVEAVVCEGGACCRLSVRGGEVCLGSGMADKVLVTSEG